MPTIDSNSATPSTRDLLGIKRAELLDVFAESGLKTIHADTLWADVHRRLLTDQTAFGQGLPKVRSFISEAAFVLRAPKVANAISSSDGFTRRFLLRFHDGVAVETVIMRYRRRITACISTQAGCAMGCVFCATGQSGFTRHLSAGEIVAQAYHVARELQTEGHRLRNIVLMGQGEPLHNWDAVIAAIDILTDERGLSIAARRITLSTVGLVPGILRLAEEDCGAALAVSLHGADDETRNALVPVGRHWPLAELMAACRHYSSKTGRHIFFEWTLIEGENDSAFHATSLARLLGGQRAHVNLIPLNPTSGYYKDPASMAQARSFQAVLREHGIPSTVRTRRGIDIAAGCGQLAEVTSASPYLHHPQAPNKG